MLSRSLLVLAILTSPLLAGGPPRFERAMNKPLVDMFQFKDVRSALLSPDGTTIACLVGIPSLDDNRSLTGLWLMPAADGAPKRAELATNIIDQFLWSPRGDLIAIQGTDLDAKEPWLWIYDVAKNESRKLVKVERGNHYLAHQGANLCWSPDGQSLAYLAADAGSKKPGVEPLVVERIQYKTRTSYSDNRRSQLWIVDVASGKNRQVTNGKSDVHSIDWSPKGDEIVVCSNREPDPDANWNNDLAIVKVSDGSFEILTKTRGNEMTPVWSPDGRSIAYTLTKRPLTTIDSVAEDAHVWVIDRATGAARELAEKLDRRCGTLRWSADNQAVYCLARDRGNRLIYRLPANGGDATPVFPVDGSVNDYSIPAKGRGSCVLSTPMKPAEVYTFDPSGGLPTARSSFNAEAVRLWSVVAPQRIECKSFDGTPVEGWLYVPRDATAQNKVPVILDVHGGPHGMHGNTFSAAKQLMVARGYAVLLLNPRGSTGYGQRFADGCLNDWGGGDYKDLMAGLDAALAAHPELDGSRLAVTGGSYGGYMTNWIITQTDRFKAAATYASLSNLISFYATSLYQDLIHVEFGGMPWDKYDILWERSPMRHIKNAKTPTLILHGEADYDVHITQSEELYTALKWRGVDSVFVRYPRQGHGASEPRQQLDMLERTIGWFDRYLKK